MRTWRSAVIFAVAAFATLPALAKVSPDQAKRLLPGGDLTPMGAEKAANKAGTIPAWEGGLAQAPPDLSRALYAYHALCDLLLIVDAGWIAEALAATSRSSQRQMTAR